LRPLLCEAKIARGSNYPDFINPVPRYCSPDGFILKTQGDGMTARSTSGMWGGRRPASTRGASGQPVRRLHRDGGHGNHDQRRRGWCWESGGAMVETQRRDIRGWRQLQISAATREHSQPGPGCGLSETKLSRNERPKKDDEAQAVTLEQLGEITELSADKAGGSRPHRDHQDIDELMSTRLRSAAQRPAGGGTGALPHQAGIDALSRRQATSRRASPAYAHAQARIQRITRLRQ